MPVEKSRQSGWRDKLYTIIFESDTLAGKTFDVALLWFILISVFAVTLESVPTIGQRYLYLLDVIEWIFTILFTLEYIARVLSVRNKKSYFFSFFGMVDFFSILPTYLSIFISGFQYLLVIRVFRLLRVFHVLKLGKYQGESQVLLRALRASRFKITVFIGTVMTVVVIIGTLMYAIEGEASGFTSIPRSMYWAIVTLTTVGYGDITPTTTIGQFLAAFVMILGYGIIAVPTGIVTVEFSQQSKKKGTETICTSCGRIGHDKDALFCKYCGEELDWQ